MDTPTAVDTPTTDVLADDRVITDHSVETISGPLDYQAETGYFDLLEEDHSGELAASPRVTNRFFLVSYLAKNRATARPVVFFFNGGPGSSSAWLHLGLFGPRIIPTAEGPNDLPVPPRLQDNAHTLLAEADLVAIDMTNTGYSRVPAGARRDEFHGVQRDVDSAADLIRLWVSRHDRWDSPIFLAGESYGVLRGTKVAAHLATRHGLYLSGLILISSTLGGGTMQFGTGSVLGPVAFLPTYAAVAHYHGFRPGEELDDVVAQAREFATGPYLEALTLGSRKAPDERAAIAAELARITGLSQAQFLAGNLRVAPARFRSSLLRSRGEIVGRNDGRYVGWDRDGGGDAVTDPSYDRIRGAYGAGINAYVRKELGYANDLSYELETTRVKPWRVEDGASFDSIDAFAQALRTNSQMQVLFSIGYYDTCTPAFGAELDLAQLPIPDELRDSITVDRYPSGHMIYLDEDCRIALSERLLEFVRTVAAPSALSRG